MEMVVKTVAEKCEELGCDIPDGADPDCGVIRVIECEDSYKLVIAYWDDDIGGCMRNTGHRYYRVYPAN